MYAECVTKQLFAYIVLNELMLLQKSFLFITLITTWASQLIHAAGFVGVDCYLLRYLFPTNSQVESDFLKYPIVFPNLVQVGQKTASDDRPMSKRGQFDDEIYSTKAVFCRVWFLASRVS